MSIPYRPLNDFPEDLIQLGDGLVVSYEQFVTNLVKERGEQSKNLEHMVIGVCGEAGELADGIKKFTIYGKDLDRANIVEELGDLEFYMAGLRQMLDISRREVLDANVVKLRARYKDGAFSDSAAITREDKVEPVLHVIDMSQQQTEGAITQAPEVVEELVLVDVRSQLPDWVKDEVDGDMVVSFHQYKDTITVMYKDGHTTRHTIVSGGGE